MINPEFPICSQTLGGEYPYLWKVDGKHVACRDFERVLSLHEGKRVVDPVAVLSVLSFEHVCLDRTLIQGITRQPWLSTVTPDSVDFSNAPHHGTRRLSAQAIAGDFLRLYEEELLSFIEDHHERIFVLLSGGMDSRIMAGVLHGLQGQGKIRIPIEAVTWGKEDSRDVVYASEISEMLGWVWHFAPLDSESYRQNLAFGALALGAEVDPKHLHRMDWFKDSPPNSLVLAASYGDSVGRAEFSSVHLTQVGKLVPNDVNRLLLPDVYKSAANALTQDIAELRLRHGMRGETGWREIERQAHYMRRHLCTVMNVINRWATLRQSFTTPPLFGFMWSIQPEDRTDQVYTELLKQIEPGLLNVPWARTGARYHTGEEVDPRPLTRGFHQYGRWLRESMAEDIQASLFDGSLSTLNIFDMRQVEWVFQEWLKERLSDDTRLCTQLSFLSALSSVAKAADLGAPSNARPNDLLFSLPRTQARLAQRVRRVTRPYRLRS